MSSVARKLFLELYIETTPGWMRERRRKFADLARKHGIELRPILAPDAKLGQPIPTYFEDIEQADAYWIRAPHLLDDERTRDTILRKLRDGSSWVILDFDRNYISAHNEFLKPFELAGTFVGAFRTPDARPEHQRVIFLNREQHPSAFRDSLLFDGVKDLEVSGVHGLLHHGAAQSVLAIPDGVVELIDTSQDFFTDWPVPELSCMAVWRPPRGRGGLLVLGANPEADPVITMFGDRLPGIDAGDNAQFCRNLLRLIDELPSAPVFDWTEAYRLLSQIESNLYQITSHVLRKAFGPNWWSDAIPEAIRQKCAARRESEHGQYPDHAYLELIEYKKLWAKHWSRIVDEAARNKSAFPMEKAEAERLFESIHPVRKKGAHPTKVAAVGQLRPSVDEKDVLERSAQLIVKAYRSVTGLSGVE